MASDTPGRRTAKGNQAFRYRVVYYCYLLIQLRKTIIAIFLANRSPLQVWIPILHIASCQASRGMRRKKARQLLSQFINLLLRYFTCLTNFSSCVMGRYVGLICF